MGVLSSTAPADLVRAFRPPSANYGLGRFALVSASSVWRRLLEGHQVCAYVDTDPSSKGLSKDAAQFHVAHNMALRFWQLVFKRPISVWFERVPSHRNIADLPTMGRSLPFMAVETRRFPLIKSRWLILQKNGHTLMIAHWGTFNYCIFVRTHFKRPK